MASKHKPPPERDLVVWDGLFDKCRPRGPGVFLFSPDHFVIGLPASTDCRPHGNIVRVSDLDDEPYTLGEIHKYFDIARLYGWVIDLDERGSFWAHVEDAGGTIVFSCNNEEDDGEGNITLGELWLTADGFMRHSEDMSGLTGYLASVGVIGPLDRVMSEAAFHRRIDQLERRYPNRGRPIGAVGEPLAA